MALIIIVSFNKMFRSLDSHTLNIDFEHVQGYVLSVAMHFF